MEAHGTPCYSFITLTELIDKDIAYQGEDGHSS